MSCSRSMEGLIPRRPRRRLQPAPMCWSRARRFFMIQGAKDLPIMPAISLASADKSEIVDDEALPALGPVYGHAPSHAALWPDAALMGLWRAFRPLIIWLRGGWLYRQTLGGPEPDHIEFYPDDPRTRRLDE